MAGKPDNRKAPKAASPGKARCPLCGRDVAAGADEAAAALNRHFGTDCTWRHTSRSPVQPAKGP